jgi:histidyl-tRNA synthetase
VPLTRYYANHANELPTPFKALQMGNVWRADRPQRGRFRQFMQCDIDILGEPGNLAEIELILATSTLLGKLGFRDFKVRMNDRRILKAMAAGSGFSEEDYDTVFIILDKMDKIGLFGVRKELLEASFSQESVERYLELFTGMEQAKNPFAYLEEKLEGILDKEITDNLKEIMDSVQAAQTAAFTLEFDATLVRGMSYYTGTIFEIEMKEFSSSCGGGGRYDKMVGSFTGQDTAACGFSIGFERIITILLEQGFRVPEKGTKTAWLLEKGMKGQRLQEILCQAGKERSAGNTVLIVNMNKNKKFQKEQLSKSGYQEFKEFYKEPLK